MQRHVNARPRRRVGKRFAQGRIALGALISGLLAVGSMGLAPSPAGAAPVTRQLAPSYSISFHNTSEDLYTNGALSGIKQNGQGTLSGKMAIALPLYGSGPFTGTVTGNSVKITVKSTVPNPCGCISGTFTGTVRPNGSIDGTYVGTTKYGTENGTWQAIPHQNFNCRFHSRATRKHVTAKTNYPGMFAGALTADGRSIRKWEKFQCVAVGVNKYAIKSRANGKYVTAELKYPGMLQGELRARAATIGTWEKYTLVSVHSCSCFALLAANSKYVSVEPGYPGKAKGLLRAKSATISRKQQFDIAFG